MKMKDDPRMEYYHIRNDVRSPSASTADYKDVPIHDELLLAISQKDGFDVLDIRALAYKVFLETFIERYKKWELNLPPQQ